MIFVSYSDDSRVDRIRTVLRQHGLSVWQDKTALGSGERTEEAIRGALAICDAAIVWIGGRTLESDYVRNTELPIIFEEARRRGLRIVPLFVDCDPGVGIERVREATGLEIGNHNGHVLGERSLATLCRDVAASELRSHLERRRTRHDRPVVRLVTRSNGAAGADDADVNLDWSIEYPADGELPDDDDDVESLQHALATVSAVVLETFGAGDVYLHLKCHLHLGVAVGFAFRRVTGARLFVDVDGAWWRIEVVEPAVSEGLVEKQVDIGSAAATRNAVEMSISREVTTAVSEFVKRTGTMYRHRCFLEPVSGATQVGVTAERNNGWAEHSAARVRELRAETGVLGIDLFIAAPIGFAVGLGWRLNAVRGVRLFHPEGNGGPYRHVWVIPDS